MKAHRCPNDHLTYPGHERCPECGEHQTDTVSLEDRVGKVVTWTTSTATPPGVRQPNHLAIVEFDVDGQAVRALGQLTTNDIELGDDVEPVHVDRLRDPGIREEASQEWDGYRFRPV